MPNFSAKILAAISSGCRDALERLLQKAEEKQMTVYLVGGCVRDALLGGVVGELDLAAVGEPVEIAKAAAKDIGAQVVAHAAFKTATIGSAGCRMDIAMARRETYYRPGALPSVHPAGIEQDLLRRDFTVNAMALALSGPQTGEFLDPVRGLADLRRGVIRVLHEGSFIDDATRIFRAARYAARLGFRVERRTLSWLKRDVRYLQTITPERLRYDLLRILEEENAGAALTMLSQWGALEQMHPSLSISPALETFALPSRKTDPQPEAVLLIRLALLAVRLSPSEADAVSERLALSRREREVVEAAAQAVILESRLSLTEMLPSQVAEELAGIPEEALLAIEITMTGTVAAERIRHFLNVSRYVKPALSGSDLLTLGVPQGPAVGEAARLLKGARLDGRVTTREEELALVEDFLTKR